MTGRDDTSEIILRRATWADAYAMIAVTRAAFSVYEGFDPPFVALTETEQDVRLQMYLGGAVVAVKGSTVVGAARYKALGDGRLLFYRLAVHPDWQRRGLAARLLNWTDSDAIRLHCDEVILYVRKQFDRHIALYERCGFRIITDDTPTINYNVYVAMARPVIKERNHH